MVQSYEDKDKVAQVGDDAPLFELQTVDGKKVNLKDLRGKGVLINFWGLGVNLVNVKCLS